MTELTDFWAPGLLQFWYTLIIIDGCLEGCKPMGWRLPVRLSPHDTCHPWTWRLLVLRIFRSIALQKPTDQCSSLIWLLSWDHYKLKFRKCSNSLQGRPLWPSATYLINYYIHQVVTPLVARLCQKSILSHLEFNTLKPELSQARALLCPKKFVILGIEFKLWQRYNLKLTLPTKLFFFLPILEKEFPRIIQSASWAG